MKKTLLSLSLTLAATMSFATSETKTLTVDGKERSFIVYKPTIAQNEALPVLMLLHPYSMTSQQFAEYANAQTISDKNNALIVFPQALDEQDTEAKTALSLLGNFKENLDPALKDYDLSEKNVWGAGLRIETDFIPSSYTSIAQMLLPNIISAGYVELNKSVDDVKFLNELFAYLKTDFNANDTLYIAGADLGGALAYKYAYSEGCQAKKIATGNAFVAAGVDTTGVAINVSMCIINSLGDSIVKYNGGYFNGPIQPVVESIAARNGCAEGVTQELPDVADDNNTVSLTTYASTEGKTVYFYLSDNIQHNTFLQKGTNDIDFIEVLEKFFFPEILQSIAENSAANAWLYPNPASETLRCAENGAYRISDLSGRTLLAGETTINADIQISTLDNGYYLFQIQTEDGTRRCQFIKK